MRRCRSMRVSRTRTITATTLHRKRKRLLRRSPRSSTSIWGSNRKPKPSKEDEMQHLIQRSLAVAGFALIYAASPALAQENVRLRATIEKVDGPVYTVKNRDGTE